jgi:hypothetical protein
MVELEEVQSKGALQKVLAASKKKARALPKMLVLSLDKLQRVSGLETLERHRVKRNRLQKILLVRWHKIKQGF